MGALQRCFAPLVFPWNDMKLGMSLATLSRSHGTPSFDLHVVDSRPGRSYGQRQGL